MPCGITRVHVLALFLAACHSAAGPHGNAGNAASTSAAADSGATSASANSDVTAAAAHSGGGRLYDSGPAPSDSGPTPTAGPDGQAAVPPNVVLPGANSDDAGTTTASAGAPSHGAGPDLGDALSALPDYCTYPRKAGDCDALIGGTYHDVETRTCEGFFWGGCGGNANRFPSLAACEQACSVTPRSMPCSVSAVDASLPGVRLEVGASRCRLMRGRSQIFSYVVEVDAPITYRVPDSNGACGRCQGYTRDPLTLIDYTIGDDSVQYCECDRGCCAPTTPASVTLRTGRFEGSIPWGGSQWQGPSDTSAPLGDPFPAGEYHVEVAFRVPGVGAVIARLPIEVVASPSAPIPGAACEVAGRVFSSGQDGIAHPQRCGNCRCKDGELACPDTCQEPCPPGTALGTSCSQCAAGGGCEVVRTACLRSCAAQSDCGDPELRYCGGDGKCKNLCR